jgi:HlyD family secretion protein
LQAAISVDEADIGEIREGLPVRFTVDAFPGEDFEGQVSQVRQQGASAQGVVTYTVMVQAANPGGRLLPGMTANAEIVIETRDGVLRLPNAALRFRPGDPEVAARAEALNAPEGGGTAPQGNRPAGGEPAAGPLGGGGPGGGQGAQMVQRLREAVNLTDAQVEIFRNALRTAREGAGPPPGPEASPEERRAFFRRMMDTAFRALEPSLTPEQKEAVAAFRANRGAARERRAVIWVLRDGEPQPVQVRLGVAADSETEVLDGLTEGDEVITGGGPQPENNGRGPSGPGGGPPGPRIRGA